MKRIAEIWDGGSFWQKVNGWLTLAWFTQFPLVLVISPSLKKSVSYLIIISIAAAGLGQLAAWQAARGEKKLDDLLAKLLDLVSEKGD